MHVTNVLNYNGNFLAWIVGGIIINYDQLRSLLLLTKMEAEFHSVFLITMISDIIHPKLVF